MPENTGIAKVWNYFKDVYAGLTNSDFPGKSGLSLFKEEWSQLSEAGKEELRVGVSDGTLNYGK